MHHVWQIEKQAQVQRPNGLYGGVAPAGAGAAGKPPPRCVPFAAACRSEPPEGFVVVRVCGRHLFSLGQALSRAPRGAAGPQAALSAPLSRGHALRETLTPQRPAEAGPLQATKLDPSLGGGRGRKRGERAQGHHMARGCRPEVTARVALSPSLSPRDGIFSVTVPTRSVGRAAAVWGAARMRARDCAPGRPEAGSQTRGAAGAARGPSAWKQPRLDFAET